MLNIRQSLFETNSSSVHAIVIPKKTTIRIPVSIDLRYGEYGWEFERQYDSLNYFYTACCDQNCVSRLLDYLHSKGVQDIRCNDDSFKFGIDHSYNVPVDYLFDHPDMLDRLIFSYDSFIDTGNDNSSDCPYAAIYDSTKYDVLMKYN